jgi:hypothetical protein
MAHVPAEKTASFVGQESAATDYFPILPNGVFYNPTPAHLRLEDLPETFLPLWTAGLPMDLTVYASEDSYFTDYESQPIWNAENIAWGDYDDSREQLVEIPTTKVCP